LKKAIILTYYWPPGSGPGVQRWLKFCKYLPEFDWQPTVITVKNGSYPYTDETLIRDVPASLDVIKTETFEPFALYNLLRGKKGKSVEVGMGNLKGNQGLFAKIANYIRANYFIPDARVGWNKYALIAAERAIKKSRPDVIITTGPPHSTHLIGKKLKEIYGIPWLADFRDPWTTIYYNEFLNRTKSSTERDKNLETSVLKECDLAMVASPGLAKEFETRAENLVFIPNGYDENDFKNQITQKADKKIRLSYIGNFKANQNNPTLWKAVAECINEIADATNFILCITGNVHAQVKEDITNAGIDAHVEYSPFVDHQKAVSLMQESDALLLTIPQSPGSELILTGKIFEYLATKRPILSIGPTKGNAASILTDMGHEPMLDRDDLAGMKNSISSIIQTAINTQALQKVGNGKYEIYSRKGLSKQLADTLNSLPNG